MIAIEHTIRLTSENHFGCNAPPVLPGAVLRLLPDLVKQSVLMAFEGRTMPRGRPPAWLERASDVRFVGFSGDDDTVLHFETPSLGEAAECIYQQRQFWDTRPAPEDTGLDLLGDVICDVRNHNTASDRFDSRLLNRLGRFRKPLKGPYESLRLGGHRFTTTPAVFDQVAVHNASQMADTTPAPNRIRVVGTLDMIRASTEAFAIMLDDEREVRGVIASGQIDNLSELWQERVLVHGTAVYRPSGTLLRVDAEQISLAEGESSLWSCVPEPNRRASDKSSFRKPQTSRTGLAAIIGKWPGEETDEEIEEALRGLS